MIHALGASAVLIYNILPSAHPAHGIPGLQSATSNSLLASTRYRTAVAPQLWSRFTWRPFSILLGLLMSEQWRMDKLETKGSCGDKGVLPVLEGDGLTGVFYRPTDRL